MAADVILQDAAKYGGPESLMVVWARLIQEKAAPVDSECGPLFAAAGQRRAA